MNGSTPALRRLTRRCRSVGIALFTLAGCVTTPCVPTEIKILRTPEGIVAPDAREGRCRLVSATPYDPWVRLGILASLETWECGCV